MAKKFLVPIDLSQLELQNARVQNLATAPASPVKGQIYFNTTTNKAMVYNGTDWIPWEADTGISDVKVNNTSVVTSGVANIDLVGTQNTVGVVKNGSSVTSSSGYTASPIISGVPYYKNTTYTAATTASAVSTTSSGGSASTYSKGDHVHSIALDTGDNNGQVKIAGSNVSVKGLNNAAYKDVDTSISSGSTSANLPTTAAVVNYVSGVADAMRFKGTLGTGGTITALPTTGVMVGDTYRVITAGTYASIKCEVGDLIIATATTPTWTVAQTNIDGAVTASTTTTDGYLAKFTGDKIVANGPQLGSSTTTYLNNAGSWATPPDTKNTAGSTDSDSKLYVIGATSQATNPQTYSNANVYIGTDDCLYSNGTKVLTAHQTYTSFTGKPTADQTPGFGDTVTVSQISQDTSGQVSGTDRTITIPNATATTTSAGLMSATDKINLNSAVQATSWMLTAGNTSVTTTVADSLYRGCSAWMNGEEVVVDATSSGGVMVFSIAEAQADTIKIFVYKNSL